MMNTGTKYKSGDIILANVQYTDTLDIKKRPVLVLYEEYDNIVVAGITSNTAMRGIVLTEKDGVPKKSIIKLNYIFTIANILVNKKLFSLSQKKRKEVHTELTSKINELLTIN